MKVIILYFFPTCMLIVCISFVTIELFSGWLMLFFLCMDISYYHGHDRQWTILFYSSKWNEKNGNNIEVRINSSQSQAIKNRHYCNFCSSTTMSRVLWVFLLHLFYSTLRFGQLKSISWLTLEYFKSNQTKHGFTATILKVRFHIGINVFHSIL